MKKILFLLLIFSSFSASGQQEGANNVRDPRAREKIRAAHAAYITERIGLTAAESEKFWPVYREYGEKRRGLRMQMRQARRTEADEKKLLHMDLAFKQQELDLEKEYTQKFEKVVAPEKLVKLQQAEADFRKLLLRQIQQRRRK